jgi:hypothetical protein
MASFKILKTIFVLAGYNGGARTHCFFIIKVYKYI